jgi:hypothetical protein
MVAWTFALWVAACIGISKAAWYDGINSIKVVSPTDDDVQEVADTLFRKMGVDPPTVKGIEFKGQFAPNRLAFIMKRGDYGNVTIPVNFYTTVMGVGDTPDDVRVGAILSNDTYPGSQKGGLENFWRSVEGLTTTHENITWGVSQAAPLRRIHIKGNLFLSQQSGDQVHYTSGGYMSQVAVKGDLHWGTQQQFFFRSCDFANVAYTPAGRSFVFVGVNGVPVKPNGSTATPYISDVRTVPLVAEKPYLVELHDEWSIIVPCVKREAAAGVMWEQTDDDGKISMDDVYVAKEGDNETTIMAGIKGKRALLLTPAIYYFATPLVIDAPDFVVLGIGFPTLVTTSGLSALVIEGAGVRVAQVLIEAGHLRSRDATAPMLEWKGHDGIGSDIFTRVGAFAYATDQHPSCLQTHADVHVMAQGNRLALDNTWFWHADHDDCTEVNATPASDDCYSGNGLVVNGDDVVAYGLAVEHTYNDLVNWQGERGIIFFFQSELPYHDPTFWNLGYVGYRVGYSVKSHTAYGVGIYQVFPTYSLDADMRVPATAKLTNVFSWAITVPYNHTLGKLVCSQPGTHSCHQGECDNNSCYLSSFPVSSEPALRPSESYKLVLV